MEFFLYGLEHSGDWTPSVFLWMVVSRSRITTTVMWRSTPRIHHPGEPVVLRFFWPFSLYTPKNYFFFEPSQPLKAGIPGQGDFYTLFNTAFKYGSERFEGSRKQQLQLYPMDVNICVYQEVPHSLTAYWRTISCCVRPCTGAASSWHPMLLYILNTQAVADSCNDSCKISCAGELRIFYSSLVQPSKNGAPLLGSESQLTDPSASLIFLSAIRQTGSWISAIILTSTPVTLGGG